MRSLLSPHRSSLPAGIQPSFSQPPPTASLGEPAGSSRARRAPATLAPVTPAAPSAVSFAPLPVKTTSEARLLRAGGRFLPARRRPRAASVPPARALCSQGKGVRAQSTVGRAARRWQSLVRVRWQRWQCAVAARYYQRVTVPVQFWVACGRPAQFRPQLPWWQPLVWRYLLITGWYPR